MRRQRQNSGWLAAYNGGGVAEASVMSRAQMLRDKAGVAPSKSAAARLGGIKLAYRRRNRFCSAQAASAAIKPCGMANACHRAASQAAASRRNVIGTENSRLANSRIIGVAWLRCGSEHRGAHARRHRASRRRRHLFGGSVIRQRRLAWRIIGVGENIVKARKRINIGIASRVSTSASNGHRRRQIGASAMLRRRREIAWRGERRHRRRRARKKYRSKRRGGGKIVIIVARAANSRAVRRGVLRRRHKRHLIAARLVAYMAPWRGIGVAA